METKDSTANNYHLKELGNISYEVAKGEPDIRGWEVRDFQGLKLGQVKELLCDTEARKVRYLILDVEGNGLDLAPRHVLIPIGLAQLHESKDRVLLPQVSAAQLQELPTYDHNTLSQEVERRVQRTFVGNHVHGGTPETTVPQKHSQTYNNKEQFNHNNLYRNRKARNVIGLFTKTGSVQSVTRELQASGFKDENIEAAFRHHAGTQEGYSSENFERFFYSLFATPEESNPYWEKLTRSNALVVVHAYSRDEANRAANILDNFQSAEVGMQVEKANLSQNTPASNQDHTTIPVKEEQASGKEQEVHTGHAHVRTQIVERPIQENIRLREERIKIERIPVDRAATQADFESFQEGSIELKEYAEVPILHKEARVVEEIIVEKEVQEHEENIRDSVRRTEIQVEKKPQDNLGPTPPSSSGS